MQKTKVLLRNERVMLAKGRFIVEIKAFEVPAEFKSLEDVENDLLSLDEEETRRDST